MINLKEFEVKKTTEFTFNFFIDNLMFLIIPFSFLIIFSIFINNTKYIRVPIDGKEVNATHFMTSKFLPLSKNNAIHFIINPTKCNYKTKTCDIVALMTSYHQAGNREYYKLLTYSIIEGKY